MTPVPGNALSHADLIDRICERLSGKLVSLSYCSSFFYPPLPPPLPPPCSMYNDIAHRWFGKTHLLYFHRLDKSVSSLGYIGNPDALN